MQAALQRHVDSSISKTVLPFVLMNYTDQLRDVVLPAFEAEEKGGEKDKGE